MEFHKGGSEDIARNLPLPLIRYQKTDKKKQALELDKRTLNLFYFITHVLTGHCMVLWASVANISPIFIVI